MKAEIGGLLLVVVAVVGLLCDWCVVGGVRGQEYVYSKPARICGVFSNVAQIAGQRLNLSGS